MMPGLKGKPYKYCLKTLELPSLSYRGKQGDSIQMFKMKAKIVNLPFEKFFRKTAINQTRRHSEKVYKPENMPVQTFSQREQSTHGRTCLNMPSKYQTSIASKTELTCPGRNTTTNSMHLLSGQHNLKINRLQTHQANRRH